MNIHIIGCGGVGSWLIPAMVRLQRDAHITAWDGDVLEEKNLDRQLFAVQDIGLNKALALAMKFDVSPEPNYYHFGCVDHQPQDIILCCADNNAARFNCLQAVDYYDCRLIIAANEVTSAEAYFYQVAWKDTPLDPRQYYPELLKDDGQDPLHPACTGEAQLAQPQLVSANFMAAALAQHLYVANIMQAGDMNPFNHRYLPNRLIVNLTKMFTFRPVDIEPKGTDESQEKEMCVQ